MSRVPNGYCGLEGTGVSCPLPFALGVTIAPQVSPDTRNDPSLVRAVSVDLLTGL